MLPYVWRVAKTGSLLWSTNLVVTGNQLTPLERGRILNEVNKCGLMREAKQTNEPSIPERQLPKWIGIDYGFRMALEQAIETKDFEEAARLLSRLRWTHDSDRNEVGNTDHPNDQSNNSK